MIMNIGRVDILAFGAHPDDIELGCSGTLVKHINDGYTVGLCDFTQGELGSRGSGKIRLVEAEKARNSMGALWRYNLGLADGFFEYDKETLYRIIEVIRLAKPRVVLANSIEDRHPDHARAAKLVNDACFYSGLSKIEIINNNTRLEHWRPNSLFHYVQDKDIPYTFVVDISDTMSDKIKCILDYETQFYQKDQEGPVTPISSKQFLNFVKAKAAVYGRDIQADYAEAFISSKKMGVGSLFSLI